MAIKKRRTKRRLKSKRRLKLSRMQLDAANLYNRLQDGGAHCFINVAQHAGVTGGDHNSVAIELLTRFDSAVKTYQLNAGGTTSFQCTLSWDDKSKPYPRPKLYCVKTSSIMSKAIILAYIEICKHAGKWL